MDDLGLAPTKFLPHDVAAGWHRMMRFTCLRRVTTDRPVQFSRIDFYVWATLLAGSL